MPAFDDVTLEEPEFDLESDETPTEPQDLPKPRRAGPLKGKLTQMYAGIGLMVFSFDPVCGQAVISSAESCAEALEQLARENPAVKRVLESLVTANAFGAVLAAHTPILLAIASHHGSDSMKETLGRFSGLQAVA